MKLIDNSNENDKTLVRGTVGEGRVRERVEGGSLTHRHQLAWHGVRQIFTGLPIYINMFVKLTHCNVTGDGEGVGGREGGAAPEVRAIGRDLPFPLSSYPSLDHFSIS